MDKRIQEFIWYHIHGDGDCNGQVLRAYAEMKCLDAQQKFDLAYFYATTYCCASAIFLLQRRSIIKKDPSAFADLYKGKLIFQSDRKYVRMRDTFKKMLTEWSEQIRLEREKFDRQTGTHTGTISTDKALQAVQEWYFFSRFSAYLFVETYCDILGIQATRVSGLDYEGDSMTFAGGLCYVYGKDIEARYIQKNHKLPFSTDLFEQMIHSLQQQVKKAGGDDSLVKLETSLCAYEKFFKGTRYNGYYADRQLEEIYELHFNPEMQEACRDVLTARALAIPNRYLGEKHGWKGIRTELKKSYQKTGRIDGYRG